jgi:hypothetical protein
MPKVPKAPGKVGKDEAVVLSMVKTFKLFMNVADLEKLLALTLHIIAQASHEPLH